MLIEYLEARRLLAATIIDDPAHIPLDRVVIDPTVVANGHKPKVLADIDRDGFADVVSYTLGDGLYWFKYPTWTRSARIWAGGNSAYEDAQSADVDNDGDIDMVVADRWLENPTAQGGNPAAGLWTEHVIGSADKHDVEVGDVNLDGKVDLSTLDGIFLQNNPNSWTLLGNSLFPDRGFKGTTLGDIDNDGDLDLLGPSTSTPFQLLWWENPTVGKTSSITSTWTRRVIAPAFERSTLVVLDMDEDGRNDIVLSPGNEVVAPIVWLKAPADPRQPGAVWTSTQIDPATDFIHGGSIEPADFNLDGHVDLFLAEQEQSLQDRLIIFFGDGTGQNFVRQIFPPPLGGHNPKIGDIDSDGDVDILINNHGFYGAPNPVTIWRNRIDPVGLPVVKVVATDAFAGEAAGQTGTFRFTRTGSTLNPLTVWYSVSGLAVNGTDYKPLPGHATIPAGQSSIDVILRPIEDANSETTEAVRVHVLPDPTYSIVTALAPVEAATITISDNDALLGGSVYLSDLNPTFASNGWGPYERDRSNGETGATDGRTITLNGVTHSKGLGVHAASELRYALTGGYGQFIASVGVDDEVGNGGSVVFQVWVDGLMLFSSGTMTGTSATQNVNVNVAGKNELRLVVTNAGNGSTGDHGDWASARLTNPPAVTGAWLDVTRGPHQVKIAFSTDVSASLSVQDLVLQNVTTGTTILGSQMSLSFDAVSNIATVTFPGLAGGMLPSGDYQLTVLAAGITDAFGSPIAGNFGASFYHLAGDANRDRRVDVSDLLILATHWYRSDQGVLQGDLNNDGMVDAADLGVLAANWQGTLDVPPAGPAVPTVRAAPVRKATRN